MLGLTSKSNVLLARDDVGKAKSTTRKLPPDGFTFGKSDGKDPEGAGVDDIVTSSWAFHNESRPKASERDFMKLNKMGLKNKVTAAKDQSNFRKDHDARRETNLKGLKSEGRLPPNEFSYGKPNRPSTPIRGVISNEFGESAEEFLQFKYQVNAARRTELKKVDPPKHTKASQIALDHLQKKKETLTGAGESIMTSSANQFKMKRFQNVEPRTETYKKKPFGQTGQELHQNQD